MLKIRTRPFCQYGVIHIWETIQLLQEFSDDVKEVVHRDIGGNAYFAHPENVRLAMVKDSRGHIRELAIRRILQARKKPTQYDLLECLLLILKPQTM